MSLFYRGKDNRLHRNRRRFPRVKEEVKVRYMVPLEFTGVKWEAVSNEIGNAGIRIKRDEKIDVGKTVALELELPVSGEKKEIVRTMAKVIWCEMLEGEKDYSVGLKFVLGDKDVQRKIARFVNQRLER